MVNKVFVLKNRYLIGLINWLSELCLVGQQSRARTKFLKFLREGARYIMEAQEELLGRYCPKDKQGQFKVRNEGGVLVWDIPKDKLTDYQKEYNEIMDEEFKLDISESLKDVALIVGNIVRNTDYEFGPKPEDTNETKQLKMIQAEQYNEWCEAFEKLLDK